MAPSPGRNSDAILAATNSDSQPPSQHLKRKRERGENEDLSVKKAAKKKKKKSKKSKPGDNGYLDLEQGLNTAIGNLDSHLIAEHVAQQDKRFGQDLSAVEMEDRYIPEKAFVDTSDWGKPRLLPDMPDFLDRYGSPERKRNMSMASKKKGAPHTIVVASAGLRAADITRVLRTFQTKEAIVAKLFAKHIKLADAIDYVKKTRVGIGVGTPSRIIDLLNAGALSSEKLERVVVDCSHIDQKKRGIFDMRETQQSLMQLLNRDDIKQRYGTHDGGISLLLY